MRIKDTLNLPRTGFPMRARLPEREPEILARWQRQDLYGQLRRARRGRPTFVLHDGPPYANGHIHLGTAMNKILKDMALRSRAMAGHDVPFVPGWDCHGMPIEHQVSRQMQEEGAAGARDVREVRRRCRDYAARFVEIQSQEFQRLGALGAWQRPYLTMEPAYEAAVLETFRELVAGGYVYRGLRAIHWCATCRTALAEAEVEYRERTSPSIHVRFPVVDDDRARRVLRPARPEAGPVRRRRPRPEAGLVIWTTTPWTLPANMAIAVHPEFDYLLVRARTGGAGEEDQLLVVAEALAAATMAAIGVPPTAWREVARFTGRELAGLRYRHPLYDRVSPVVAAEHVTLEQGTGLVHTAPGHGHEDFEIGQAHGLEVLCPVDGAGVFDERAGEFAGRQVFEANPAIVEALRRAGALLAGGELRHSYPHCWRCKSPLIYRATEQWFLDVSAHGLRRRLLETIRRRVQWVPEWGMERIASMVETRPDWCLSRQRAWGVPIPALYCRRCRRPHLELAVIDRTIEIVRREGSDAWFQRPVSDFLPEDTRCQGCGGSEFEQETDILDVWFESGVSHRAVLHAGTDPTLSWPADLYLEGHDQHRGWFQVSLITAVSTAGEPPCRTVVTHGFVVDEAGRKMSKSLGNVIEPQEIVERYGADILRLYFASVDHTRDTPFSRALLEPTVETYRKIRNTLRFLLANLYDFDPAKDAVRDAEWRTIDRWAMDQAARLGRQVRQAYDAYRFHAAVHRLHHFCAVTLSAIYLDVLKDRLYVSAPGSGERRAAQTVLWLLADALTRWLAPVLPFTAEEVWGHLPGREGPSVHLATFPDLSRHLLEEREAAALAALMRLRGTVMGALEEAREQELIGSSLEAAVYLRPAGRQAERPEGRRAEDEPAGRHGRRAVREHADWLADLFIVSHVELLEPDAGFPGGPATAPRLDEEGTWEVVVRHAEGQRCERCWSWRPSVGSSSEFPTLCGRCVEVLEALTASESA